MKFRSKKSYKSSLYPNSQKLTLLIMTLAWGETVPLYYLDNNEKTKIIIIGFPRSRQEDLPGLQKQLENFSKLLFNFFNNFNEEVVFAFSGDLAHTHKENGPYGYHQTAEEFDNVYNKWVSTLDSSDFDKLVGFQPTALACGMAGISTIQNLSKITELENDFNYYNCPTYFGMSITKWKIK